MNLISEINTIKDNYENGTIELVEGLEFSQKNTIKRIEYILNSKYESGDFDSRGKKKPFFNTSKFRLNIAIRATDFDTKDIQVVGEDTAENYVRAMILREELRDWMDEVNFAKTLNDMGTTRASHGGVIAKRIIKDGQLHIEVPVWKNTVSDPVDIASGTKMEKHYMNMVDIQSKKEVWKFLEDEWDEVVKVFKKVNGKNFTTADKVCVLEIEGAFPNSYLEYEGETDFDEEYSLQRHIVLCGADEQPVCCLHSEEKKETDYKYLSWFRVAGRALGVGVIEDGFESQLAMNDIAIRQKQILEYVSKIVYKTDDTNLANNNLLDTDNGFIVQLSEGRDISLLNSTPNSFPILTELVQQWDSQYERVSSTFDAVSGESMPSGTPFRAVAIQNQEASSLFQYRKEEFGIFVEEIMNDWVLPFLAKKINKEHILRSENFSPEELSAIDEAFKTYQANQEVISSALNGKVTTWEEYQDLKQNLGKVIASTNKSRFLEVPKDYFKDFKGKVKVITTGEQVNKAVVFESISNIIALVGQNPAILQDPVLSKLFGKIVEMAGIGISPAEIANMANNMQQPALQAPEQMQEVAQSLAPQEQQVV